MKPEIQKSLRQMGIASLTDMQKECISTIEKRQSVRIEAPTGAGKTYAYLIPALDMTDHEDIHTKVLIIAPTRELAVQISEQTKKLSVYTGHHIIPLIGGINIQKQENALKNRPTILVATAGRLLDLMHQGKVDLANVSLFVIDEADEILSTGQKNDVSEVMNSLPDCPHVLVSATWNDQLNVFLPENYKTVQYGIENTINPDIQVYYDLCSDKKGELLRILAHEPIQKAVIFTKYIRDADSINQLLINQGYLSAPFSSYYDEGKRLHTIHAFHEGKIRILTATDAAARGLDISDITHVIHYDLPDSQTSFIHRSGRSAHQNHYGITILLITPEDKEAATSFIQISKPYQLPADHVDDLKKPLLNTRSSKTDAFVLWINAGKKEKLRPKDIIGALCTIYDFNDLGALEIQDTYATIVIRNTNPELMNKIDILPIKGKIRKYRTDFPVA